MSTFDWAAYQNQWATASARAQQAQAQAWADQVYAQQMAAFQRDMRRKQAERQRAQDAWVARDRRRYQLLERIIQEGGQLPLTPAWADALHDLQALDYVRELRCAGVRFLILTRRGRELAWVSRGDY